MMMEEKMQKADAKNAVKEYVDDMRDRICGDLAIFISPEERTKFNALLDETENWLSNEGKDEQKSVYLQRLSELRKYGDPVLYRYTEAVHRPIALSEFKRSLESVMEVIMSYHRKGMQYDYFEPEEMSEIKKVHLEYDTLYGQYVRQFAKLKPYENPPITAMGIQEKRENFENQLNPILSKPKPER